jgi:hypothetical protein
MKESPLDHFKRIIKTTIACAAIGCACLCTAHAQTPPDPSVSPDLQEIVKLSSEQMSDNVITNYVKNSGKTYNLSADDIIYLKNQGVSQGVISFLLQTSSSAGNTAPQTAPPPPPDATASSGSGDNGAQVQQPDQGAPPTEAAPASPPVQANINYFQSQLTPYGNWVNVPGYGFCWEPVVDVNWRPYYDGGHWAYTDAGWYWQSDYPWGDIAFHYGRWAYVTMADDPAWVWIPGYDYAPSWVVWRHDDDDGYIGWGPLPPAAIFVDGGWTFHGARVGADFAFGLGDGFFAFVDYGHLFFDPHLYPLGYRHFIVPHDRLVGIYRHSVIENHYAFDHGRFINRGLDRDRMAVLTHHDIRPMAVADIRRQEEQRNAVIRGNDVRNFRPGITRPNAIAGNHGFDRNGSGGGRPGEETGHFDANSWTPDRPVNRLSPETTDKENGDHFGSPGNPGGNQKTQSTGNGSHGQTGSSNPKKKNNGN